MSASLLGVSSFASGNEVLFTLVFAALFGLLGYRISARHRVLRGVTPWRFPSLVWALICFAIGPIGLVVELVAEITTRPRLPSSLGRIASRPPTTRPVDASHPGLPAAVAVPVDVAPPGPPPPRDEAGAVALFGWYADPTRRHELRYFDGRHWSELVADGGASANDPL